MQVTFSFSDIVPFFSMGLAVWLSTWGLNRVYLTFKMLVT